MSDLIYINQTLHGYADGHQLLATSVDLTPEEQSTLLVMSDLSGPAFRGGYETYLTGYPLAGGTIYCLARTWFAPELPRPGCVWTQTFLIKAEDLARIIDFDQLNDMYYRPTELSGFGAYCRRLPLDQRENLSPPLLVDGGSVLRALYDGGKRVVISSEASQTYESLALAVFEQQWPKLRRSFRFCSGALSLRDTEFELSVSPPEATHSLSEGSVLASQRPVERRAEEEWLEIATRDLTLRQKKSELREFLWRFGPEFAETRAAFRPLTEIFCLLKAGSHLEGAERLLSAIGHFYPQPTTAGRLKAAIFGAAGEYAGDGKNEGVILKLLVSHPLASAISSKTADMRARARAFSKSDMHGAIDIALTAAELGGDCAQQFLEGVFESSEWSPEFIRSVPFELLTISLGKYPDLIYQPALWSRADRMEIVDQLLSKLAANPESLRLAISSMMEAGAWDAISRSIRNGGASVVKIMFSLIDSSNSEILDYPDVIHSDISRGIDVWMNLIQSGQLGSKAVKFLSADLDARSWYVRKLGLRPWALMLETNARFKSPLRALHSSVFALSVGLSSWNIDAAKFVSHSFSSVYAAAAGREINETIWQQLEPSLSWYSPSWDKCARLVRSVARAFKERNWPLQDFFLTFKSEQDLSRALNEIDDTYGGSRFIREARERVLGGNVSVSKEQLEVMIAASS
jgi:GTPase-associated protein 1, N-terminal domain type 1